MKIFQESLKYINDKYLYGTGGVIITSLTYQQPSNESGLKAESLPAPNIFTCDEQNTCRRKNGCWQKCLS